MANVFNQNTNLWKVDTASKTLADKAPFSDAVVGLVYFVPNASGDDLVFQDSSSGVDQDAIVMKANSGDTNPVQVSFLPGGLRVKNLKCTTIDGGTAYVYLL